jgi:hypothetical protein
MHDLFTENHLSISLTIAGLYYVFTPPLQPTWSEITTFPPPASTLPFSVDLSTYASIQYMFFSRFYNLLGGGEGGDIWGGVR